MRLGDLPTLFDLFTSEGHTVLVKFLPLADTSDHTL